MALVSCDFYSDALEVGTAMTVVLPQPTWPHAAAAEPPSGRSTTPVLYLLHGLSDDHTMWQRQTSVERYAAPLGLAVVMPAVHRSFYADEAHGHAYWTFLSQELPQVVSSMFRVSDRPEYTYVGGLSMGGYGALKWALHEPARFAAVASMSGVLDVAALADLPERRALFHRVFEGAPGGRDDLFSLLRAADADALPPMHISCGTEDHLFDGNGAFVRAARDAGLAPTVDFRPGQHDWAFWDAEIHTVLEWLPGLPR